MASIDIPDFAPGDVTRTALAAHISVVILRRKRNTCGGCANRRVLYAVMVSGGVMRDEERLWRCKPCAGL